MVLLRQTANLDGEVGGGGPAECTMQSEANVLDGRPVSSREARMGGDVLVVGMWPGEQGEEAPTAGGGDHPGRRDNDEGPAEV